MSQAQPRDILANLLDWMANWLIVHVSGPFAGRWWDTWVEDVIVYRVAVPLRHFARMLDGSAARWRKPHAFDKYLEQVARFERKSNETHRMIG